MKRYDRCTDEHLSDSVIFEDVMGWLGGLRLNLRAVSWTVEQDVFPDPATGRVRASKRRYLGSFEALGLVELPDQAVSLTLLGMSDSGLAVVSVLEGVMIVDYTSNENLDTTKASFVFTGLQGWTPVQPSSQEGCDDCETCCTDVCGDCCNDVCASSLENRDSTEPRINYAGCDLTAVLIKEGTAVRRLDLESVTWNHNHLSQGPRPIVGNLQLTQWDVCPLEGMLDGDISLAVFGNHPTGAVSLCVLEGLEIHSSTHGFSANDLGNTISANFSCSSVVPWHRVDRLEEPMEDCCQGSNVDSEQCCGCCGT